ncbi:TPA: hypothetical protein QEL08_002743 [Stenotrophomonas maltophilia]|nr:hypothetical protein [Stenotrophomonas maltophilia]
MSNDKITAAAREPYDAMGPIDAPNPPAARATLADVQPGGMVRLGDQALSTSEGARRYVADYFATQLSRHDFGDYILTELAADFACALAHHLSAQPSQPSSLDLEAMLATCVPGGSIVDPQVVADNIRHWFSAQPSPGATALGLPIVVDPTIPPDTFEVRQPSPGGQGDALASLVARWRNHAEEIGVSDNLLCQKIANCTMRHAAELQAVLAARQPVGENPAWRDELVREAYNRGLADGLNADRQPVGQIVGYMDPNADFMLARPGDCVLMGNIVLWREPGSKYTKPLYDAPPVKAVDLGAVREALQAAEGLATVCASVDGYSREEVAASGRAMRQQFADALAKVDSQAVGNG